MRFYRLIKPRWAQAKLANGNDNPEFIEEIQGPDIIEGCNFEKEFLIKKNNAGYGVYFFPNHPDTDVYAAGTKHLNGKSINTFKYVFVDMDLKDGDYATKEDFLQELRKFPLKPTFVHDSGNGIHAYWEVENLTRSTYVITQLALLNKLKTDNSVWTVLQLMRAPGYLNTKKHNEFKKSSILKEESSAEVYKISDFPKEIYNLDKSLKIKAQRHIDRLDGKLDLKLSSDVDLNNLPEKFLVLLETNKTAKQLFENPESVGDRSSADMKLANLLFSMKFNINEAVAVLSNTQKALEKGANREAYVNNTVSKVYSDRPKHKFQSVADFLNAEESSISEPQINGPSYLDAGVLGEPWRRKELLGLIAGSGVGKTSTVLNIISDIIKNNPHNDDVFVFFSLEMSKKQVMKRWVALTKENPEYSNRLYVIDTQDENGMPIDIGIQEIYEFCTEIKQCTGKHIGAFVVDHFHILSTHIDTRKKPNFGIDTSAEVVGKGFKRNLQINDLATQLKSLVKILDTYGIILSQTSKEKGKGDVPIAKDGAFGSSKFDWIIDRLITIWQPLLRVQNQTPYRFLAYQYVKIREKRPNDKIHEYEPKLLTYNLESGKLSIPSSVEYQEFTRVLPLAQLAREEATKKNVMDYSIFIDTDEIDGIMDKLGVNNNAK